MNSPSLNRCALGIFVAGLLAGCGAQSAFAPTVVTRHATQRSAGHRSASFYGVLLNFDGSNGSYPDANLITVRGTLFGTTESGGRGCKTYGCGTVFSITTAGEQSVVYRFHSPRVHGGDPTAGLIFLHGGFYGTTVWGGDRYAGTVFHVTTDGKERVLHSFGPGPYDGLYPSSGLIALNDVLYGTTRTGGTDDAGTVYSITTSGTESVIYNFQGFSGGRDGAYPAGDLTVANGVLYGTTFGGGKLLWGTIFKVTTSGMETVLHEFKGGSDGYYPGAGLMRLNGKFYGTTERGGDSRRCRSSGETGCGAVFEMTTSGKESVVYRFKGGTDGQFPFSRLVALKGALYGTTSSGGAYGFGTVFRVTTDGKESVLYSFGGEPDGETPYTGLTKLGATLYGTTSGGGSNGDGIVFEITP